MNHRPKHLDCVNTAEGINRINEDQRAYDGNPERAEREYARQEEERAMDALRDQEDRARYEQEQEEQEQYNDMMEQEANAAAAAAAEAEANMAQEYEQEGEQS